MSRNREVNSSSAQTAPRHGHESDANILIIQSAHPNRILRGLEWLRANPVFSDPRYTLLCSARPQILEFFQNHPMLTTIHRHSGARNAWRMLRRLKSERYDGLVLFFTGESGYWKMILFAIMLRIRRKLVFDEDNDCLDFTWHVALSLFLRHLGSRLKVAGPSWKARLRMLVFRSAPQAERDYYPGERILILQSAEPGCVLNALERLRQAPLFSRPRYTLFCRAFPEVVERFKNHPMLYETRLHTRTHNSWNHLRSLRRERFDAVVLFLTGDPGYWKVKVFAFLLGARHKVVFNENNDCFYFDWRAWFRLLAHRMASRSSESTHARSSSQAASCFLVLVKILFFPFRFAWLLIVWLRLRRSAMRASS